MEIPVLARMSDFDASIASLSLANHPLISRFLSIFQLGRFPTPQRFWKWGALLLALMYAFSSVVGRIKLLFLQHHKRTSNLPFSSEPLLSASDDEDIAEKEGDQNDDVRSACSSEGDSSYGGFFEDFRVAGRLGEKRQFSIRRRRSLTGDAFSSLAELVSGKGIVKLWDGLGLEFDLGDSASLSSSDSISIFDLDRNVAIGSIPGQIPAVSVSPSSPRVIFTASSGGDGRVGLSSWDMRLGRRRPAMEAEWRTGPVLGLNAGGVDKVYVTDDVSRKTTVGDMRKPRSPLVNVTEYDGERWFHSNAVTQTETE